MLHLNFLEIPFTEKVAPKIQRGSRKVYGRSDAFAPVNLTIGDSLVAEDGAMIEVMCHATGSPEPKITWLRRGIPTVCNLFLTLSQSAL